MKADGVGNVKRASIGCERAGGSGKCWRRWRAAKDRGAGKRWNGPFHLLRRRSNVSICKSRAPSRRSASATCPRSNWNGFLSRRESLRRPRQRQPHQPLTRYRVPCSQDVPAIRGEASGMTWWANIRDPFAAPRPGFVPLQRRAQHRRRLPVAHARTKAASGFAQQMIALTDRQQRLRTAPAATIDRHGVSQVCGAQRFHLVCFLTSRKAGLAIGAEAWHRNVPVGIASPPGFGKVWPCEARWRAAWRSKAAQGRLGGAWCGTARQGPARRGCARTGMAWQANGGPVDFLPRPVRVLVASNIVLNRLNLKNARWGKCAAAPPPPRATVQRR